MCSCQLCACILGIVFVAIPFILAHPLAKMTTICLRPPPAATCLAVRSRTTNTTTTTPRAKNIGFTQSVYLSTTIMRVIHFGISRIIVMKYVCKTNSASIARSNNYFLNVKCCYNQPKKKRLPERVHGVHYFACFLCVCLRSICGRAPS